MLYLSVIAPDILIDKKIANGTTPNTANNPTLTPHNKSVNVNAANNPKYVIANTPNLYA